MFKHLMDSAAYNDAAAAATVLFFAIFAAILLRTIFLKKSFTNHMSRLPLDEDREDASTNGG